MNSALYVYFRRWPTPAIFRSQTHELATETDTKIVTVRNQGPEGCGGEGGILPLVQQEIPVMMVKPNLRVCNGTEAP
jgi:hypothetical protein